MNNGRYLIRPNPVDFLTLSGVVTSAGAVAVTLKGHYHLATAILFIAMLGDALDGMLARRLGLVRHFGRYLDGFMDVLIYLVAPSLIFYLHGFDGPWSAFLLLMIACGCTRLAVFNDIGNIQEEKGLAYLGMPVFWSIFMLAGYLLLATLNVPATWLHPILAITLVAFSHAMVRRKPFFKFSKLSHILFLTLGGALLFFSLHLHAVIAP
ncbi:MAG: CDP-alcohol phosphatidyltransferase family protein [Gammaproteobacteria bacterium]